MSTGNVLHILQKVEIEASNIRPWVTMIFRASDPLNSQLSDTDVYTGGNYISAIVDVLVYSWLCKFIIVYVDILSRGFCVVL